MERVIDGENPDRKSMFVACARMCAVVCAMKNTQSVWKIIY